MSKNAKLITNSTVTVVVDGKVATMAREIADRIGATAAAAKNLLHKALDLMNREQAIKRRSVGAFVIENGVLLHNGLPVHNVVAERIITFLDNSLPFEPLVNFLKNLLENPSARAVSEGYDFLEHKNLPITDDGNFLAYKCVAGDYRSKTGGREPVEVSTDGGKTWKVFIGRIPNNVGNLIRVARNLVDDNRERECSYGLHVGALAYAGPNGTFYSQGDKVVIVKVNPRDIVAVPRDYDAQKMRVSAYEVISNFQSAYEAPLTNSSGNEYAGSGEDEPEVVCNDCGWEGDNGELTRGYRCPECDSNDTDDYNF